MDEDNHRPHPGRKTTTTARGVLTLHVAAARDIPATLTGVRGKCLVAGLLVCFWRIMLPACRRAWRWAQVTALNRPALSGPDLAGRENAVTPQPGPSLRLTVEQQVLWTVVRVSGELGWESYTDFDDCLCTIVWRSEQPRICVDLSGLQFCDSAGIACLVRARRAVAQRDGQLVLRGPDVDLARRLVYMGLDGVLPVVDNLPG
jgi:anti-sigma B factor antagonist